MAVANPYLPIGLGASLFYEHGTNVIDRYEVKNVRQNNNPHGFTQRWKIKWHIADSPDVDMELMPPTNRAMDNYILSKIPTHGFQAGLDLNRIYDLQCADIEAELNDMASQIYYANSRFFVRVNIGRRFPSDPVIDQDYGRDLWIPLTTMWKNGATWNFGDVSGGPVYTNDRPVFTYLTSPQHRNYMNAPYDPLQVFADSKSTQKYLFTEATIDVMRYNVNYRVLNIANGKFEPVQPQQQQQQQQQLEIPNPAADAAPPEGRSVSPPSRPPSPPPNHPNAGGSRKVKKTKSSKKHTAARRRHSSKARNAHNARKSRKSRNTRRRR